MRAPILASILAAALVNAPVVPRHHGRPSARLPQQFATLTPADIDRVVNTFTTRETEFRNALAQYSFKRDAFFQTFETSKANLYNFKYIGRERIDDFDLHVFDVSPKTPPNPKKIKDRVFQGRIRVDVADTLIVKSRRKGLPEPKYSAYPTVEIVREEIEKGTWFPTYAYADEELMLGSGAEW
jgi:hypothetical protein